MLASKQTLNFFGSPPPNIGRAQAQTLTYVSIIWRHMGLSYTSIVDTPRLGRVGSMVFSVTKRSGGHFSPRQLRAVLDTL